MTLLHEALYLLDRAQEIESTAAWHYRESMEKRLADADRLRAESRVLASIYHTQLQRTAA